MKKIKINTNSNLLLGLICSIFCLLISCKKDKPFRLNDTDGFDVNNTSLETAKMADSIGYPKPFVTKIGQQKLDELYDLALITANPSTQNLLRLESIKQLYTFFAVPNDTLVSDLLSDEALRVANGYKISDFKILNKLTSLNDSIQKGQASFRIDYISHKNIINSQQKKLDFEIQNASTKEAFLRDLVQLKFLKITTQPLVDTAKIGKIKL